MGVARAKHIFACQNFSGFYANSSKKPEKILVSASEGLWLFPRILVWPSGGSGKVSWFRFSVILVGQR